MISKTQIGILVSVVLSNLLLLTACLSTQTLPNALSEQNIPAIKQIAWLQKIIHQAQSQPQQIQAIYHLEYQHQSYYMVVPGCCDRFSVLYNTQGQEICAPSGGFTGRGDGKCGNLDHRLLSKTKIWPKKSDIR